MKDIKKPELLMPAGNLEKLKIAITYGADAVFIGGQKFSLRARANNFSIEEIKKGCEFAIKNKAKVYVTANIFAHEEDDQDLNEYLIELEKAKVTGIIVSDPLIIQRAKEVAPKLEIHISTQQSSSNSHSIKFWERNGAQRVVLARELKVSEIKNIKKNTNIEIEVFIHGAMCIAYSGRCTLSNHMTARDSNRGGCSQSCRWKYETNEKENFTMSPADLQTVKQIEEFIECGIDSLKVEGRMKSIHYIATIASVYRNLIDNYFKYKEKKIDYDFYINELNKAANRPLGHLDMIEDHSEKVQLYNDEEYPNQQFLGIVKNYDKKTNIATIEQRNKFVLNQEVEFFNSKLEKKYLIIDNMKDEDGNIIESAPKPKQIVKIKIPKNIILNKDDMFRKRARSNNE